MSKLAITLNRSTIGHPKQQKDTVRSFGLRRMHQTTVVPDNPSIRGMLFKVRHLVSAQPSVEPGVES